MLIEMTYGVIFHCDGIYRTEVFTKITSFALTWNEFNRLAYGIERAGLMAQFAVDASIVIECRDL
jgi:hypothetical protein